MHRRAAKLLPAICAHCGASSGRMDVAYRHDAPSEYRRVSRDGLLYSIRIEDYVRLDRRCHRQYDVRQMLRPHLVQTNLLEAA